MSVALRNNAFGVLAQGVSASTTQIELNSGHGTRFPALGANQFFYATLVGSGGAFEIVMVIARTGDIFTVIRGQEDTTPQSFAAGSKLELRVTVGNIVALIPAPQITVSNTPPPNPVLNQLWLEID
jgi:hypothetical protein